MPLSGVLSTVWSAASPRLRLAVIMTIALSVMSCATKRQALNRSASLRKDSGVVETEVRKTPLKVSASTTSLTIPKDRLSGLPEGAAFTSRQGQASLRVETRQGEEGSPDTIYVYATCDSLELQCEEYSRRITSLSRQLSQTSRETVSERRSNGVITRLKWFLAGLLSGPLAAAAYKILKKLKT